jgi:23S rRNA (guanosine2251-2'-O)-methyltransferase
MPGNSQRKGAVRKRGKTTPAGSGGRVRHSLEGRGPTPKAEDRPYHKAYRERGPGDSPKTQGKHGSGKKGGSSKSRASSAYGDKRLSGTAEWVFGRNPVLEALQAGVPVKQALIAEGETRDSRLREILSFAADNGIPFLAATKQDLDRVCGGGVHQGVALRVPPYEYAEPGEFIDEALETGTGVVVALDSVTDPHNLGAIVRSAAAFGALGLIITERRSAQMNATSWKTSAGAAARLPIARAKNLNQAIRAYADAGFQVVGLDGEAETSISDISAQEQPVLLIVGSEGHGLSRLVSENCDVLAAIPIAQEVESLNASVAAAIALYEVTR